jgi:hypothetical protein
MTPARRYAIVIEDAGSNYGAYSPDLPGCVAVGDTVAETEALNARGDRVPPREPARPRRSDPRAALAASPGTTTSPERSALSGR